ncbi:MAG: hypothetical protein JWO97_3268 [Acidobacteria bacterium]|nr:hypothetical protein [Acidobacteriota bacterium]
MARPLSLRTKLAILSIGGAIAIAYGWSSYTQRFTLTNEPDAVKDTGAIRVESSFSQRDLSPGERVQLNLVITNRSPSRLTNVRAVIETPGLYGPTVLPKIDDVAPNERQSSTFALRAGNDVGQFRSRITVVWNANQQQVVLLTPPTIAVRNGPARATWIAAAIQSLSKDLALPIIVIILASIFKRAEEEENRRSETWQLLLPRHNENASVHYLPLLGVIGQFDTNYRAYVKNGKPDDVRKAFFFFLVIFWRMRRVAGKIGGMHFKNRDGEKVAARAWKVVVTQTDVAFRDRALRDAAIDSLTSGDEPMSIAQYVKRLEYGSPYRELRARFLEWQTKPAAGAATDGLMLPDIHELLLFFLAITSFECNRPYEHWYGTKVDFPREAVDEFVRQPLFSNPLLAELREPLRSYLDAISDEYNIAPIAWHTS